MNRRKFLQWIAGTATMVALPIGIFKSTDRVLGKSSALGMPYGNQITGHHHKGTTTGRFSSKTLNMSTTPRGESALFKMFKESQNE